MVECFSCTPILHTEILSIIQLHPHHNAHLHHFLVITLRHAHESITSANWDSRCRLETSTRGGFVQNSIYVKMMDTYMQYWISEKTMYLSKYAYKSNMSNRRTLSSSNTRLSYPILSHLQTRLQTPPTGRLSIPNKNKANLCRTNNPAKPHMTWSVNNSLFNWSSLSGPRWTR